MDMVKIYPDNANEWRWRRISENGRIVSESGEGYTHQDDCKDMAVYLNGEGVRYVIEDAPR